MSNVIICPVPSDGIPSLGGRASTETIIIEYAIRVCIGPSLKNYNYNMIGVAVATVVSTVHEKSWVDLYIARKFEQNIPNSIIHISRNHRYGFL